MEFTTNREHRAGRAPTLEKLLLFYVPNDAQWQAAIEQLERCGVEPVQSFNPSWDRYGKTYAAPDGYRVVIQNGAPPRL